MAKKAFNIRIDEDVLIDLEKVANAAGMDRNDFGALWLRKVSQLKLDYGLDALTSIPKDYFKSHGGRPPKGTDQKDARASVVFSSEPLRELNSTRSTAD